MTLYALLVYAVLSSPAVSDSQRMATVIAEKYRRIPDLELVEAPQTSAPLCSGVDCIQEPIQ
jgi:hypothetical protein